MLISILLLFSAIAFGMGVTLPIVRFERLFFFEDTPSLLTLVKGLWQQGSVLISIAVAMFSIVFPIVKLAIVFQTAFAPQPLQAPLHAPLMRWAPALAKWSMMDVLLVALVIFAAKTSGLANAVTQPGLWFYASSAISGAVAASLLKGME